MLMYGKCECFALVITLSIICRHISQENMVSDKSVLFVVDSMTVGFPA